jgi:hypothetical protein
MTPNSDETRASEAAINLHWGRFGLKMLLALVWLSAGILAATIVSNPAAAKPVWFLPLAIMIGIAPLAYTILTNRKMKQIDEREQKLVLECLVVGYGYALGYGSLMWLLSVWQGSWNSNSDGVNHIPIVALPALGFFFGEALTQYRRWVEVRHSEKEPKA